MVARRPFTINAQTVVRMTGVSRKKKRKENIIIGINEVKSLLKEMKAIGTIRCLSARN